MNIKLVFFPAQFISLGVYLRLYSSVPVFVFVCVFVCLCVCLCVCHFLPHLRTCIVTPSPGSEVFVHTVGIEMLKFKMRGIPEDVVTFLFHIFREISRGKSLLVLT